GRKAYSPFSEAEMERRQDELRGWMTANAVDAALFTSFHSITYYSGWLYCQFGRKYGMVVTPDNATTISSGIDGGRPWRRSFVDNLAYTDWRPDNFYRAVRKLTPGVRRLAIEFDHVSLDFRRRLEAALPGVELMDVSEPAMWMRCIKSIEERLLLREAARIAELGATAGFCAIRSGAAEHEVALAATTAMNREIAGAFPAVEVMDSWTWFQSGSNSDGAHNPVTAPVIEAGDILSLSCFPTIFGYSGALGRTLFCRNADDASLDIWEKNLVVRRCGLDLIRPGARCSDIARELNAMHRNWGLLRNRACGYGHSLGITSHYYGREAALELREDVDTVLKPGMVLALAPMLLMPEGARGAGGYREIDMLIVTDTGADPITFFPVGPEHNIIRR
ncbi:aminopeptidase P family protein, partial [Paracoccus sp. PXZ]